MVAGKLDPTIDRTYFCRIFQTVRNLKKKTMGMSSESPKMGGGRYGSAWNGRKKAKSDDPKLWPRPRSTARSRCIRRQLTVKFRRQGHLVVLLLPGQRIYQRGFRKRLPRPKPVWPKNWSKCSIRVPQVLRNFCRVLVLKMSVLELGSYLARKTRFI